MLELVFANSFKRDLKLCERRGKDISKFWRIIEVLRAEQELPARNRNHKLAGNMTGNWECHIEPDWLLIYQIENDSLILTATGTHSDLFS